MKQTCAVEEPRYFFNNIELIYSNLLSVTEMARYQMVDALAGEIQ